MNSNNIPPYKPPPGFVEVESQVPGISVYAPAPKVETTPEAVTFKCPQCGATTAYDPNESSVTCQHCGYTHTIEAQKVGRLAEEREFTLENIELAERGWGEDRRELHCDSCGADLSISFMESHTTEALSTTCPFCGSNRVVARTKSKQVLRPRHLIPFKFDAEACPSLAKEWLGRGWMHPKDLANTATSAPFNGLYLPFWTFDAQIQASWRAEVGYERKERYYDHSSKSWKERTRIDWRWESGEVDLNLNDWIEIGTSKISHGLLERTLPFDLEALITYEPGYLAGWSAHAYTIPLQESWVTAKASMHEHAREASRAQIRSSHVRNFSMVADFSDERWRYILLPVFITTYRYQNETYQVLVNGQTAKVSGLKPVAWWKVWLAIAALLLPGALLALAGLPLLLLGGIGSLVLLVGAALLLIGGWISIRIYRQAVKAETA